MCMGLASRFFYTLSTQLIIPNYLYIWWSNEINLSCIRKEGCNQQTSPLKHKKERPGEEKKIHFAQGVSCVRTIYVHHFVSIFAAVL